MSETSAPLPAGPVDAPSGPETGLADGQWHRLHPATPLLRGGFALIVVAGIVISNFRERIVALFLHTPQYEGDPVDLIIDRGLLGIALLVVLLVVGIAVVGFYLSWRVHTFRITEDAVEVRSGLISRSFRTARLDRIQGITTQRPLVARLFGAAKLEIIVAGHDANLPLAYLGSSLGDRLRREILRRASGVQKAESVASDSAAGPGAGASALARNRVDEFISPSDLDPDAATPDSIVRMHPGRLAGSLVISGFSVFVLILAAMVVVGVVFGQWIILFAILPSLLGLGGFYVRRFTKSLRYHISGSTEGVRVGFGLLATSSETLPPNRIHAVEVLQPLLWRPFGWWQIRVNTAGRAKQRGAAGDQATTLLPVGDAGDVERVLPLLVPGLTDADRVDVLRGGMGTDAELGGFTRAPRRARFLRPFSWRRVGWRIVDGVVVIRTGVVWRRTVFVPLARLQSVEIEQGPLRRALSLAEARVHCVDGPARPSLPVLDPAAAIAFLDQVMRGAIEQAALDRSHLRRASTATPSGPEAASASPPEPRPSADPASAVGADGASGRA